MKSALKLLVIFTSTIACCVLAQTNYSINWFRIAGGGGTSSNSQYNLSGTIGQSDAGGTLFGGNYSLVGGYWSLYTIQTPGSPLLKIRLTETNTAIVYWPSPSSGFALQVNTNLTTTTWLTPAEAVQDNGTNRFITVNPPGGTRFYRLKGGP